MTKDKAALALSRAAKERWMKRLCTGSYPFTEAASLMKAFGVDPKNLQALIREGKVLAFNHAGQQWFPKYQFGGDHVLPVMEHLLKIARQAGVPDVDLALWMMSSTSLFAEQDTPAAHMDDPAQVIQAAHLHFEEVW